MIRRWYHRCMTTGECEVQTCDRPATTRGWCQAHYNRVVKLGDARPDVPLRPRYVGPKRIVCSVDGCDRRSDGNRAWCAAHRKRRALTGDVQASKSIRIADPFDKWCSYETAHGRTRRARGSASAQPCIKCGAVAMHWAYNGKAKHEFTGMDFRRRSILFWSGNPADYDPMCASCHKAHDTLLSHLRWLENLSPALAEQAKQLLKGR